jgi:hypothetical protein
MGEDGAVRRPALVFAVVCAWTLGTLLLDRYADATEQVGLAALTTAVLIGLLALQPATVRLQALAVGGIATLGEVVGSLIWGLYGYRLENLPPFVPPGHALVYLAGLALATLATRRSHLLLGLAAGGALVWGLAGVTVLPTPDLSGTMGCAFLLGVLAWTRRPVYAGVFLVVAGLELYGTALGTWRWESTVPGLGLSQGNPPSGVASGYVLFDVLALALVAWLGRVSLLAQSSSVRRLAASSDAEARMSARASSTLPHVSQSKKPRAVPSSPT